MQDYDIVISSWLLQLNKLQDWAWSGDIWGEMLDNNHQNFSNSPRFFLFSAVNHKMWNLFQGIGLHELMRLLKGFWAYIKSLVSSLRETRFFLMAINMYGLQ